MPSRLTSFVAVALATAFLPTAATAASVDFVGRKQYGPINHNGGVIVGQYLYVVANGPGYEDQGMKVFDISNPASLQEVGFLPKEAFSIPFPPFPPILGEVTEVAVRGNYAYVTGFSGTFHVVDVSNPAAPTHVVGFHEGDYLIGARDVEVGGDYAYVAHQNGFGGLAVIDVSNPAAPAQIGHYESGTQDDLNGGLGVEVVGTTAYLSTQDGVHVIDVTTPTAPSLITTIPNTEVSWDMDVHGGYLYLTSSFRQELDIFDISNPRAPALVGVLSGGHPSGVEVAGTFALVSNSLYASGDPSIFLVDVTDKTAPQLLDTATAVQEGMYNFQDYLVTMVSGNHAFVLPNAHIDVFSFGTSVNAPPVCASAQPSISVLWPPNHKLKPVSITGVTDPEGAAVTVTITGVTQDEPVNGLGDGNTSPDAVLGNGSLQLRAERAGIGNGRVYRIAFSASDGNGGTCVGAVRVGVPHSRNGNPAVDDGQLYNSFAPDSCTARARRRPESGRR